MSVPKYSFSLFILTLLLVISPSDRSPAGAQAAPPLDFRLIYRAAQLASHAYDKRSKILVRYGARITRVATPGKTNVQYVLLHDHQRRIQIIAVRGTVDDTNWKLDRDKRIVRDGRSGVMLHRGFRRAADTIFDDVRQRLRPDYTTYLTGHSLGGAVAAILGIYLWDEEALRLGGIYTFGQPKFTNLQGATAYRNLPILRVVYQNDTVPLLPDQTRGDKQQFVHIGPVLNLLTGPYYLYGTAKQATQFSKRSFRKMLFQISLPDHKMKWYLQSLRDKQDGTRRVRFRDRNRHITRHKYGSGVDTALPKRQYNFNHHN
ncbi:lipase family protein [Anderseniella sp. Alg231-50]|uniref:lipase family protein n=1 Tax=Anderseniella sp. Alg231-50 TaxID=1922226 RepID=UPI000D55C82E